MVFHRYDAKMRAKLQIAEAYPHPMLVTLVYLLATKGLSWLAGLPLSRPFENLTEYLESGIYSTTLEGALAQFLPERGGTMLLFFLTVLLWLYSCVMSFGYASYSLRLARGEQPSYRNLLDGFAVAGKVIRVNLLISLFLYLWAMAAEVLSVPLFVLLVCLLGQWGMDFYVMFFLAAGVFLVLLAAVLIIGGYRYRLTLYFLLDHPEMRALEAITQSKLSMRGYKGTLFLMDLSFLGWAVLSLLTFGILGLWLTPYHRVTEAYFYDAIASREQPPQTFI